MGHFSCLDIQSVYTFSQCFLKVVVNLRNIISAVKIIIHYWLELFFWRGEDSNVFAYIFQAQGKVCQFWQLRQGGCERGLRCVLCLDLE